MDKDYELLCKKYGTYFHNVRISKGLSLRQLSSKCGISIALISLLESGIKLPRIESLLSIAKALDINISDIFSLTKITEQHSSDISECLRELLITLGLDRPKVEDVLNYIQFQMYKMNKVGINE